MRKTNSGNYAEIVHLFEGRLQAVVYISPSGEILSVKHSDIYLYSSFEECKKTISIPSVESMEDSLLAFWGDKISHGNPGSAVRAYDIVGDKIRDYVLFDDEGEYGPAFDLSDFFEALYRWGRGDVAYVLAQ